MAKSYLRISPRNPHLIWKNLLFFKSSYVQCNCSWLRKCAINIFHFICVCFGEEFIFKTPRSKIWNFVLISHRYSHSNSMGRLKATNNKLVLFSLSVSTLLFPIFICFTMTSLIFRWMIHCAIELGRSVLTTFQISVPVALTFYKNETAELRAN